MKFLLASLAIIVSLTEVYGQRNEIPEIAFLFKNKVINIDTLTFKKMLVIDTIQNPNRENIYCSNFSDLFHLPSSYEALLFYLNSSDVILNNKSTPAIVPSTRLCMQYINLKIKAGDYHYVNGLNSDYIISDDVKFDIILFPGLRDTLSKLTKKIIGFAKNDREIMNLIKIDFNSDKSKLEFIKTQVDGNLKFNKPYSKGSLEVMLSILKNVIAQQSLNSKSKKELKVNYLEMFSDIFFAIDNKAINNNINDIPITFNIVDSLNQPTHFDKIYYCPVWNTLDIREITCNNPTKSVLPISDYYFWGSNDGIKKLPDNFPRVYKIRWQSLDVSQKIILKYY
ncbi:hypothetical protein [Ferruginibacter sp.]|nr:hypothetical protein [Ferruginibacter sp.]